MRLKGGDPFVFGRGGEEAEALADAGVPFEVVPGVSAMSAVPASAGIPVTHRGVSAQVTLVSGHSASGEDLDYAQLARTPGTLVVFMGLAHLADRRRPIAAGKDPPPPPRSSPAARTPTAARSAASSRRRRLAADLDSPALLVVGDVVAVGNSLAHPRAAAAVS